MQFAAFMLCYTQDDANAEGGMYYLQHFYCPEIQPQIDNNNREYIIMMIYNKQPIKKKNKQTNQ